MAAQDICRHLLPRCKPPTPSTTICALSMPSVLPSGAVLHSGSIIYVSSHWKVTCPSLVSKRKGIYVSPIRLGKRIVSLASIP